MSKKIIQALFYAFLAFSTFALLKDGNDLQLLKEWDWLHFPWVDKFAHIFIFFVLMYLRELTDSQWGKNGIVLLLYGVLIEVLQGACTETRTFDIFDIIADGIGIIVGTLASQIKFIHNILKLQD